MSRKKRTTSTSKKGFGLLALAIAGVLYWVQPQPQPEEGTGGVQTTATDISSKLEIPTDPQNRPDIRLKRTGYTASYNKDYKTPNWVGWELTRKETTGQEERKNRFLPDPDVPAPRAEHDDYTNSGYDRGHMAPAADMKWSAAAMSDCHYLTNIAPQAQPLNTGAWATLEENCRSWAIRDSAIYVVCGPILTDMAMRHIGKSGVSVPQRYFKVVIAPYANPPRGIGFIMPNRRVAGGVQATATTIDHIEAITGYDFFAALPDEIETTIESQSNYPLWQRKI